MKEEPVVAHTENVIVLTRGKELVGLIHNTRVFNAEPASSEEIAKLIDPEFGVIARKPN